jgi:mRNA-degrading endonuclease RelE of RelBE toxin-antitoxin system
MGEIIQLVYPENFDMKNILMCKECDEDLRNILVGSGLEDKFASQFRQRLKFLEQHGRECVKKNDWFEKLKKANDIYSMRFKLPKNIRILFTIKGNKISILLCTFEEKGDKVKGKNSYKDNIEVAITRLTNLEK